MKCKYSDLLSQGMGRSPGKLSPLRLGSFPGLRPTARDNWLTVPQEAMEYVFYYVYYYI